MPMYEDIRKNKWKSGLIVALFILVITLIVYYVCMAFHLGTVSIGIALLVSILSAWSSYYFSDSIVLSVNRARPATEEEDRQLVNILNGLMVASGLENTPRLYVVEDAQPNAFATGRNPKNAVICVTTGLLDKLDYYELEGVLAHELSHIKNYDIRLSAVVSVMVGFVVMLSDWVTRTLFWFGNDHDEDSKANAILFLVGLIFLILAPIFGQLMQLAISRKREFLADATAASFTRNPEGLIRALRKLDSDHSEMRTANNATAHMFIVSPFKASVHGEKRRTSMWSTHPSIDDRIEALQNLK